MRTEASAAAEAAAPAAAVAAAVRAAVPVAAAVDIISIKRGCRKTRVPLANTIRSLGAHHDAPGGKKNIIMKIVGEFAENVANSPTDTARTEDDLHGRFVMPLRQTEIFSEKLCFATARLPI